MSRLEVMKHLEKTVEGVLGEYLRPIDSNWQPSELLPDSTSGNFFESIKDIQDKAKSFSNDFLAVLIGDTITEEALPTYESWLYAAEGISPRENDYESPWLKWTRSWTAEENRHGDALNKYLTYCGRINMREVETTTQYLIADGFNIQTGQDPYRNFVYTSFQEMATNISHRRVASLAKQEGDELLAKICGMIASDENRHARAYSFFADKIFEVDPNEMMLAFADMMRKKIVMPAHFMRELGGGAGETFKHFSDSAQRLGVYTSTDYIDILKYHLERWKIDAITGLDAEAEKARDFVMNLPLRLEKISERIKVPTDAYHFRWISA
ncbi:MAG: acyl-ACP desaturase [Chloroherpetonaceae bacterium]|nr:acyl-ACP desaturase [Chloroherpetonaceae bacterium]